MSKPTRTELEGTSSTCIPETRAAELADWLFPSDWRPDETRSCKAAALLRTIPRMDADLDRYARTIDEKNELIETLESNAERLATEREEAEAELSDARRNYGAEIDRLREEIARLNGIINQPGCDTCELAPVLAEREAEVERLAGTVKSQEATIRKLTGGEPEWLPVELPLPDDAVEYREEDGELWWYYHPSEFDHMPYNLLAQRLQDERVEYRTEPRTRIMSDLTPPVHPVSRIRRDIDIRKQAGGMEAGLPTARFHLADVEHLLKRIEELQSDEQIASGHNDSMQAYLAARGLDADYAAWLDEGETE